MTQIEVAQALGLTQQTVQEHRKKAITNIAAYHANEKVKVGDDE